MSSGYSELFPRSFWSGEISQTEMEYFSFEKLISERDRFVTIPAPCKTASRFCWLLIMFILAVLHFGPNYFPSWRAQVWKRPTWVSMTTVSRDEINRKCFNNGRSFLYQVLVENECWCGYEKNARGMLLTPGWHNGTRRPDECAGLFI